MSVAPDDRGPVSQLARLFLTQLLAVVAVAAVIAVVFALAGRGTGDLETGPAGDGRATSSPDAGTTAPATPDAASPTTTPAPAPATPTTPAAPSTPEQRTPRVDVLNQSAGSGAAELTAQQLEAQGVRIGRVDNFNGNVSTTTVYWLRPGLRGEARDLAELLGGVRVQEGFSTLDERRLSVVLVEPVG